MKIKINVVFMACVAFMVTINTTKAAVTFQFLPSDAPPIGSVYFSDYVLTAANAIKLNRTLPTGTPTSPTDPRLLQQFSPYSVMYTDSRPYYKGNFAPTGAWTNAHGNVFIWWIVATAGEGETTSLADQAVTCSGSDQDNIFSQTISWGTGKSYAPGAPGIRADGSVVDSGPATQQVKHVIIGVISKGIPITSAEDERGVLDFFNQYPTFQDTLVVTAKGSTAAFSLRKSFPMLFAIKDGDRFKVALESNGDPSSYTLQATSSLTPASWGNIGAIRAGETLDVGNIRARDILVARLAPKLMAQGLHSLPLHLLPRMSNLSSTAGD